MKIPKSFQLFGQTIDVVYDPALDYRVGSRGQTRYRENRVLLHSSGEQCEIPETRIEQTFCHELVHWILFTGGFEIGGKELDEDDRFVDVFAHLLHQALTTAKYE